MTEENYAFASQKELQDWLIHQKGVDPEKARKACDKLFDEGYDMPMTLLGATAEELTAAGIPRPIARYLSNMLEKTDDDIKELVDYVRSNKTEAETLVISEPKSERFRAAVQVFRFKKDAAKWVDKPCVSGVNAPTHTWLKSEEDSKENHKAYMAYLSNPNNIRLPQGTRLFEGSSEKDLLSMRFLGFGNVKTSGNIDVVLAGSHDQSITTLRQNILAGIELKKDANEEHSKIERQVILQHHAASYLNPDAGILTLMTDLNTRWHFFWFAEGKRLMRYEASMSDALFLIQHSLDEQGSDEQEPLSTPTCFLNRASWNGVFPSSLDSIPEVKSFEERDQEDAESQGKTEKSVEGGTQRRTNRHYRSQQSASRSSRQGKPQGMTNSSKQHKLTNDPCLEYMDEEERLEETFRMHVQTSFHRLLYVPEVEKQNGTDGLPAEIMIS